MAVLTGTLLLSRSTVTEVVDDPNTPRTHIVAGTSGGVGGGGAKAEQVQKQGAFRQYGNGNTRLILGAGTMRQQTLALRALTPAQLADVEALLGHTIIYRDTYGRKVIGAFLDLQIVTIPFSGTVQGGSILTDVGLMIQSVTYSEEV